MNKHCFFRYSLGKAQRLMKTLEGIANIHVHSSIHRLNEAISSWIDFTRNSTFKIDDKKH